MDAAVRTSDRDVAFLYDAGLVGSSPSWKSLAWAPISPDEELGRARGEAGGAPTRR